jgi:Uma2 family endonuclease
MGLPARRRATYRDVLEAPPHLVAEVVMGDLTLSPRPAGGHGNASTELIAELTLPFGRGRGGPGGWIILSEPELHLGPEPDILVPDLAGWRRERLPEIDPEAAFFTIAPDWICEVLSPATATFDRARKLPRYAAHGVPYAWLVDPLGRSLEAFARERGKWLQLGMWTEDEQVIAAPFDAVPLQLGALWANLKKPAKAGATSATPRSGQSPGRPTAEPTRSKPRSRPKRFRKK